MLKDEKVREALRDRVQRARDTAGRLYTTLRNETADAVIAALSTTPAQAEASTLPGEVRPIAYLYQTDSEEWISRRDDDAPKADCDFKVIALGPIASPPTTPAAESGEGLAAEYAALVTFGGEIGTAPIPPAMSARILSALRASEQDVERVARAIHGAKMSGHNPDCLYQHHDHEDWPVDDRREYADPFTGEPRVQFFHKAWRHYESAARAALAAINGETT